ncbi:MAG TPA: ABC transporter permease [Acidimicrobiales bacterium]
MTTVTPPPETPTTPLDVVTRTRAQLASDKRLRIIVLTVAGFAALSVARVIADTPDLTEGATFSLTIGLASPILLAGLCGLVSERSGIINIGLEGMMVMGTFFAGWAGYELGPWWALVFGVLGGMLAALLHAVATVTFGVDQIVSGVAINLITPGVARFLANELFVGKADGTITQSPSMTSNIGAFNPGIGSYSLEDVSEWFGRINEKGWFFISDVAGLLQGVTSISKVTLIAWLMLPLFGYILWRTAFGLRLRSAGEKPAAADSLGVSVYRMRYLGVTISGGLAGLGGAWLVLYIGAYNQGQVAGRGFQGLAAMIFGNWRPGGLGVGAGLFAYAQSISLGLEANSTVLGLILLATFIFAAMAVVAVVRRKVTPAIGMGALGVASLFFYMQVDQVNNQIVYITPYVVTLLVLTLASQRLRPPAAEGKPWFKGQSE